MLTPKPIERSSWALTDRGAMFDALDELAPSGWRGGINCGQDGQWRVELNSDTGHHVTAYVGQRLILEPLVGLLVTTDEQADDNYDPADGS